MPLAQDFGGFANSPASCHFPYKSGCRTNSLKTVYAAAVTQATVLALAWLLIGLFNTVLGWYERPIEHSAGLCKTWEDKKRSRTAL